MKITVCIALGIINHHINVTRLQSLVLSLEVRRHQDQNLSAPVHKLRNRLRTVRQLLALYSIRPQVSFEFLVVFDMKTIIEDKIFHSASEFSLHRLENRIVLSVDVGEKHNNLVITIQLLPVILRIVL